MRYLRIFLIVTSTVGIAWAALAAKVFANMYDGLWPGLICLGLAALLSLNAYYLYEAKPPVTTKSGRLAHLFQLWLLAKEMDLKRRANPAD